MMPHWQPWSKCSSALWKLTTTRKPKLYTSGLSYGQNTNIPLKDRMASVAFMFMMHTCMLHAKTHLMLQEMLCQVLSPAAPY